MPVNCLFSGRTPKESESITDCQDYFEINEAGGCFAIADGASQSFYPAIWAELLVKHFCENPEINVLNWKTWLEPIQAQWLDEVRIRVETAKSEGKPTWIEGYNGLNAQKSATSTFIGLRFSEDKIKACIVGDSCLFVIRNRNLQAYPLEHSEDFNDRPEYFASYSKDNHFQPRFFDINFEQSDDAYVIIATDALSEYILKCYEQKQDVFSYLLNISSQKLFENFVSSARHQTVNMKNDDVTLLILGYNYSLLDEPALKIPLITDIGYLNNDESSFLLSKNFFKIPVFFKKTQKTKQSASRVKPNPSKTIAHLKQQRAFLIIIVVILPLLSLWLGRITSNLNKPTAQTVTTVHPTVIPELIPAGSTIYVDRELSQPLMSLFNPSEVLILEEGDRWIKFQVELYGYKIIVNSDCTSCHSNEIEILSDKNIRVFPSTNNIDIFGQLNRNTKFQKLDFKSVPDWYKFQFVGYIAK